MKLVDLNVVLYAVNADAPEHSVALRWWEEALNGDESIGLPWIVLLGFLRLATSRRVFATPISTELASGMVSGWLGIDVVCVPTEKPSHWGILRDLLGATGTAGNLTTDAHLAALAISHDAVLVSCDQDFGRFAGLRRENPLAAGP